MMTEDFFINVKSKTTQVEWSKRFKTQIAAEWYIRFLDQDNNYTVLEFNFKEKYSSEELDEWKRVYDDKLAKATYQQESARYITRANRIRPDIQPCEVCGQPHENYHCCDSCNYDTHTCHFCGDYLGHNEVSVCYLMEDEDTPTGH